VVSKLPCQTVPYYEAARLLGCSGSSILSGPRSKIAGVSGLDQIHVRTVHLVTKASIAQEFDQDYPDTLLPDQQYFTTSEAAQLLGIGKTTLREMSDEILSLNGLWTRDVFDVDEYDDIRPGEVWMIPVMRKAGRLTYSRTVLTTLLRSELLWWSDVASPEPRNRPIEQPTAETLTAEPEVPRVEPLTIEDVRTAIVGALHIYHETQLIPALETLMQQPLERHLYQNVSIGKGSNGR
jgi:hypothetical protein